MAPRFGTDGIRGVAGTELGPVLVAALGAAAVDALGGAQPFLIARDTRASGPELEAAFIAGVAAAGGTTRSLGVLPTPGLAGECAATGAPGAMISASHNPWSDNGVKLFEPGGRKLRDATEAAVEAALAARLAEPAIAVDPTLVPDLLAIDEAATASYVERLRAAVGGDQPFAGRRVVLDLAHGAAFAAAPRAFEALGALVTVIGDAPDGRNINADCGSTHPEVVSAAVVAQGADVGFAFDGDADRVMAVDATGSVVDGDHMLAILAIDLDHAGRLTHRAIATTVMANLGLTRALAARGIDVVVTPVGDRHVLAAMETHGLVLGGEQSGHVIAAEHAVTGDGPLTAVLLLDAVGRAGRSLGELAEVVTPFPQLLESVRVVDRKGLDAATGFWAEVHAVERSLGDEGRVVVRPSGTEPVVRIMVEAADAVLARRIVDRLTTALHTALG